MSDGLARMTPEPGYPAHRLAREPAPPYAGEGPFALWHFSEDPAIGRFEPRPSVWPFWRRVTASTVESSGGRLRNAADHPERL